jgi:PadR family transcriptional regulator, regulatory protein PadR
MHPNQTEAVILGSLIAKERYGREIRDEYERRTGRTMPLGSLYTTLDRMVAKGFLRSREGEETSERGGNRRKYFEITASGRAALDAWDSLAHGVMGRLAHG